jgi:hypothetical protein
VSFIIGFSFIILLIPFTVVLGLIAKRLPKEMALSSMVFMMVGDAVLVGLWYYGLLEIVESIKQFKLGIAGAFCMSSMGRSIYFLLQTR